MKLLAQKVLAGPSAGPACLTEIVTNAPAFVAYLRENDPTLVQWEKLEPSWIADVYQAVAVGLGTDPKHDGASPELFQADRSDREAVGIAFREVLLPSLPQGHFDRLVRGLQSSRAPLSSRGAIEREPDVLSGGPDASRLAACGLTPVDLVLASDGVGMLLERAIQAEAFHADRPLIVRKPGDEVTRVDQAGAEFAFTRDLLVDEMVLMTEVDPQRSAILLDWLVVAAGSIPALFMGFESAFAPEGLTLNARLRTPEQDNLLLRWRCNSAS